MSEESVISEQGSVNSEGESRLEAGGTNEEKLVPVSEAIRYRKRAQAAEKELGELKESFEKQGEELATLNEQTESSKTPSSLRGTGPLQGESLNVPKQDASATLVLKKTQGVKEPRTGGARGVLQGAARQAANSGSRSDVQEYLRLRRSFV